MRRQQKNSEGPSPGELLSLWVGQPDSSPPARRLPPAVVAGGALAGVLATLALAGYTIDVLLVLVGLVVLGFVLHGLGSVLAKTDVFSPGWILTVFVFLAVSVWALVPERTMAGLEQFVPRKVVEAVAWLESRGLALQALIGRRDPTVLVPPPPVATGGTKTGRPAPRAERGSGALAAPVPSLTVTVSSPASRPGQRVVFMARMFAGSGALGVRFYDGSRLMGFAQLREERGWALAFLPVADLGPGSHDVVAEAVGRPGSMARSVPVRHVVR